MGILSNINSKIASLANSFSLINLANSANFLRSNIYIYIYRLTALFLLVFLSISTIIPIYIPTITTEAATDDYKTSPSLTLDSSSSSARVNLLVSDAAGTFASSNDNEKAKFTVSTNNYTGYTLTIKASDNTGNLSDGANTISSITTDNITDTSFSNGQWGYVPSYYNGTANSNYHKSPTTTETTLDVTDAANSIAKQYTIGLGVKADYTKPASTYTKTFILAAVANNIAYSITYTDNSGDTISNMPTPNPQAGTIAVDGVNLSSTVPTRSGHTFLGWCDTATTDSATTCSGNTYTAGQEFALDYTTGNTKTLYAVWELPPVDMQNLDPSLCTTASPITVTDTRDNTTYKVQQLADGNCWLLDNLALDLTNADVKTKLISSTTNASDTSLGYLKNGGGTTSDKYATAGVANWTSSYSYSAPLIASSGTGNAGDWTKDTVPSNSDYGNGSHKIGIYYNFCAASAGSYCYGNGTSAGTSSGDAAEDICPAGWRMPTGGSSGEYQALYAAYSSNATNFKTVLSVPLSGSFASDSAYDQGISGRFWSSIRRDNSYMYRLTVDTSSVSSQDVNRRDYGSSVRCVLKPTMQNFTADDASVMAEGETKTLADARDGNDYTVQKINGNIWMTQNLRFSGTSIEPTLTNINTTKTISWSDLTSGDTYDAARYHNSGNTTNGYWYNYAGASAMTITGSDNTTEATYSICPAGWRLPTNAEFTAITSSATAKSAFAVTGGNYLSGQVYNPSYGYWWSSTANGATNRYYLLYGSGSLYTYSGVGRDRGFYVRCILNTPTNTTFMQDIPSSFASQMTEGDAYSAIDVRDNTTYNIAKLADGNIWLLDNLALDLTSVTLDKLKGNTNATDTILTYLKNGGGSSPYPSSGVSTSWSSSYNLPKINTGYITTKPSGSGSGAGNYQVGVYYNYCAASAGSYCYASGSGSSSGAQYDICPSGWMMPYGNTANKSYYYLYNTGYSGNATNFKNALSIPLSGGRISSSTYGQGSYGYFWSSTYYNGDNMYDLYVNSSSVAPQSYTDRGNGFSVRCVLK